MQRWLLPVFASRPVLMMAQGCVCDSWDLGTPGLRWTGGKSPGPTAAGSLSECRTKCCDANQMGTCIAFSYDANAAHPQACTLWESSPQKEMNEQGWTSGTLSAPPQCEAFDNAGWLFAAALGGAIFLYFACGVAFKKLNAPRHAQTQDGALEAREWLPHQQFWYGLAGLVVDGVMCCARCGETNAPPTVAKPDFGTPFLTAEASSQRNSWASPAGSPDPAGLPAGGRASTGSVASGSTLASRHLDDKAFEGQTSLHHACKTSEATKLRKLLRALKAVGADLRAMDTVDGRGFTPFHVACACGHTQVVEALCDAGCDPFAKNADGHTGWQLAQSLERTEVLALSREELNATAQSARKRRIQEIAGGSSPHN